MLSLPAAHLPDGGVERLAAALRGALADLAPFTLTAGSPLAGTGSVELDLDGDLPGQSWARLSERVGDAIGEVFGPAALQYRPPPPHLTVAYCARATDSGRIQSALRRRVRPSHAPMTVDAVHLLDVHQDAHQHTYTWPTQTAIRIPLAGT